jgi:hypothetical protein
MSSGIVDKIRANVVPKFSRKINMLIEICEPLVGRIFRRKTDRY